MSDAKLTDKDIAVLEHMRSRTTPGEWFISEEDGDICATVTHTEGEISLCEEVGSLNSDADNCFAATAHGLVPAMLAELRSLRAAQVAMTQPGSEALLRDIADVVRDSDIMQWDSVEHRGRAIAFLSMLIGQVAK